MPLEVISEDDWLHNVTDRDNHVRLVDWYDVKCLRHNEFAISASLYKTVFAFHFSDALYVLKP